jgi:hypothetical protein
LKQLEKLGFPLMAWPTGAAVLEAVKKPLMTLS